MFFVAVPEHGASGYNLHYHLLVRVPAQSTEKFKQLAEPIWRSLEKRGSLHVQDIADSQEDRQRVVSYDLKEVWQRDSYSHMFFSNEFSPLDAAINKQGDTARDLTNYFRRYPMKSLLGTLRCGERCGVVLIRIRLQLMTPNQRVPSQMCQGVAIRMGISHETDGQLPDAN